MHQIQKINQKEKGSCKRLPVLLQKGSILFQELASLSTHDKFHPKSRMKLVLILL